MIRTLGLIAMLCATPVMAQEVARVLPAQSVIQDDGRDVALTLNLTQAVPHRVFTLDDPRRLIVDFEGLDWTDVAPETLNQSDAITDLRFGAIQPGWSRLVIDLADPFTVATAGMTVAETATLAITLTPTNAATFTTNAGAPVDDTWTQRVENTPSLPAPTPDDGLVTVVIDPGHGGVDPGAVQGGVQEADLMLQLAIELAASLNSTGQIRALLTRNADVFVSLEGRMSIARAARADLMISLHADALEADDARGASVYTLSEDGSDRAAARMVERHERGDLLAGLDLRGQGDRVATVLMDLARIETGPRSDRFADATVSALRESGARLNTRPRREGQLAVLNAPDFAAVLIEAGFLSNDTDRAVLSTAAGRGRLVEGITQAIQLWAQDEATLQPHLRQ